MYHVPAMFWFDSCLRPVWKWLEGEGGQKRTSNIFQSSDSHSVVCLFSFCSCPAGTNPSISLRYQSQLPGRWSWRCSARSHWGRLLQRAAGVRAHLPAPPGWAVPQQPLRGPVQSGTDAGICERSLRHGHRQHLWAGRPASLQHHRVGQKHPILPRTARLRAGQSRQTYRLLLFFFSFLSFFFFLFQVQI